MFFLVSYMKGWRNYNKTGNSPKIESWRHGQSAKGIKNKIPKPIYLRQIFPYRKEWMPIRKVPLKFVPAKKIWRMLGSPADFLMGNLGKFQKNFVKDFYPELYKEWIKGDKSLQQVHKEYYGTSDIFAMVF